MSGYFSPKSESGISWVPCAEYEIPEYMKMGIDVYAAYEAAFFKTRTGSKWERNIVSRFDMKRVTDYSHRALKRAFPKISRSHRNISFFAKVRESDITEGGMELISYVGNHGVYVTDRERGKYLGYNVYILGVGTGLYHKLLYVHREQTHSLLSLANHAAVEYFRRNNI